jgi:hypothetical protein
MVLEYSTDLNELSVTITHSVGSDPSHYIKTVTIRVNGSIVDTHTYTSQPNPTTFTYKYNITANTGAVIQTTAVCSISGSITRSITVGSSTNPNETIPGFIGFILLTSIVIGLFTIIIKKKLSEINIWQ